MNTKDRKIAQRQYDNYVYSHAKYEILEWILEHKTRFNDSGISGKYFEYPDYHGMPKRLFDKLSGDMVDRIQMYEDQISDIKSMKQLCELLLPW